MGAQDACSLPSTLVGTQSDLGANIEGQNITTVAQLPTDGLDAVETGGSPVSDQVPASAGRLFFFCWFKGLLLCKQTVGSNTGIIFACELDFSEHGAQDASPLPLSSPGNHPDAEVNIEGLNNTTVAEPYTTGSDGCELEIAEPGPQVERSTFASQLLPYSFKYHLN